MQSNGNYLTQERILKILSAAASIVDAYNNMLREVRLYAKAGANDLSADTVSDIMNRNAVDFDSIQLIAFETGHFISKRAANESSREAMRRLRERRKDDAELEGIDFTNSHSETTEPKQHSNGNGNEYQEPKPIDLSQFDLNDPGTYQEFHRTLRANLDTTGFVWESDICRTLLIAIKDIGPIIKKMIDLDMLQAQSANGKSEMMNRYHIL